MKDVHRGKKLRSTAQKASSTLTKTQDETEIVHLKEEEMPTSDDEKIIQSDKAETNFSCDLCSEEFSNENDLANHINVIH